MGAMALRLYSISWLNTNKNLDDALIYYGREEVIGSVIAIVLFCFFVIWSLYVLINIRMILLTNKRLIIRKPLLFLNKEIQIADISSVEEEDYVVRNRKLGRVYKGKKTIIKLIDGRKIKYESLSLQGYYQLNRLLGRLHQNRNVEKEIIEGKLAEETNLDSFKRYLRENEHPEDEKQMARYILFIIIAAILTFGFIYAVFIPKP